MTDPADRDPVLMAVADGLETTAEDRGLVLEWTKNRIKQYPDAYETLVEKLLRDVDRLLSERHRAEEAMRERARNRLLELKRVRPDGAAWLLLAANAVNDLPLTPEPTHER